MLDTIQSYTSNTLEIIQRLFPFYLSFDAHLKLVGFGRSFPKLEPALKNGRRISEFMSIKYPQIVLGECEPGALLNMDQVWMTSSGVSIPGQVIKLHENLFLFAGSPAFSSVDQLARHNLKTSDFEAHASPLEHLFLKQAQITAIEDQERITKALLESEQHRKSLLELQDELVSQLGAAFDLKIQFDCNYKITDIDASKKIQKTFSKKDLIGKNLFSAAPFPLIELERAVEKSQETGREEFAFTVERYGETLRFKACLAQSQNTYLLLAHDYTNEYMYQREIERRANYDFLTDTLSRSYFLEQAKAFVESPIFKDAEIALFLFDLDGFKGINELHGLSGGDHVLKHCAMVMKASFSSGSLITRLGGDEFAAITFGGSRNEILAKAKTIMEEVAKPVPYENSLLRVECSLAVSFLEAGDEKVETLNQKAHIAMCHAKLKDRGSLCVFDQKMAAQHSRGLALRGAVQASIEHENLDIHFQPIVCTNTGAIASFEALVRWDEGPLSGVSVEKVIKSAEESGQIMRLGKIIIQKALCAWGSYRRSSNWITNQKIAINISAKQLTDTSLLEIIPSAAAENRIPNEEIVIELTETAFNADQQHVVKIISEFKNLGFQIALDDFGTGYSSLAYLENLPIDKIKIDRVFISAICDYSAEHPLLYAIVKLAKALKLEIVAEGVETEKQAEALFSMGCEFLQGYYFSKPLCQEEFFKLAGIRYIKGIQRH